MNPIDIALQNFANQTKTNLLNGLKVLDPANENVPILGAIRKFNREHFGMQPYADPSLPWDQRLANAVQQYGNSYMGAHGDFGGVGGNTNLIDMALKKQAPVVNTTPAGLSDVGQALVQAKSSGESKMAQYKQYVNLLGGKVTSEQRDAFFNYYDNPQALKPAVGDYSQIPLYHGTNNEPFSQFNPDKFGNPSTKMRGVYFTTDRGSASQFGGNVAEAQAGIKKPLVIDGSKTPYSVVEIQDQLLKNKAGLGHDLGDSILSGNPNNYDAVVIKGANYAGSKPFDEVIVTDPSKIKIKNWNGRVANAGLLSDTNPVVNPKTGERLNDAVAKLEKYGWRKQDIQSYKDKILGVNQLPPEDPKTTLTSLNPTGGLYVDYTPEARMNLKLGRDITTYDKTSGLKPDELVTIYRGVSKPGRKINPGDFITTDPNIAQSYGKNILETQVPASHILDDVKNPGGGEYIYRPQSHVAQPSLVDSGSINDVVKNILNNKKGGN